MTVEPFFVELIPQLSRERVQQLLAGITVELPVTRIDASTIGKVRADIQSGLAKPFGLNVEVNKASLAALRKQIEEGLGAITVNVKGQAGGGGGGGGGSRGAKLSEEEANARREEAAAKKQRDRIDKLGSTVVKLGVEIDSDAADRDLRAFTERFTKQAKGLRLTIDDEQALEELDKIEKQLAAIPGLARKALDPLNGARPKSSPLEVAQDRVRRLEGVSFDDPALAKQAQRVQTRVQRLVLETDKPSELEAIAELNRRVGVVKSKIVVEVDDAALAAAAEKTKAAAERAQVRAAASAAAAANRTERDDAVERRRKANVFSGTLEVLGASRESTLGRGARGIGRVAAEVGGPAAGVAIASRLALAAISNYRKLAEEVRDVANSTGLAATEASSLVFAFKAVQINSNLGAKALFQFSKNADNPALKNFGINVTRTAAGTIDLSASLLNVADAFNAAESSTGKTNVLFAAFGRQAETLVPLLEKGRVGILELQNAAAANGLLFSAADLKRARDFEKSISLAKAAFSGLGQELAQVFVPVLATVAKDLPGTLDKLRSGTKIVARTLKAEVQELIPSFDNKDGRNLVAANNKDLLSLSEKRALDAKVNVERTKELDSFRKQVNLGKSVDANRSVDIKIFSDQGKQFDTVTANAKSRIAGLVDEKDITTLKRWREQLTFSGTPKEIAAVSAAIDEVAVATHKLTLDDFVKSAQDGTRSVDDLRSAFLSLDPQDVKSQAAAAKELSAAISDQAKALIDLPKALRDAGAAVRNLAQDEAALVKLQREASGVDPTIRLGAIQERISVIQAERQAQKDIDVTRKAGIEIVKTEREIIKAKGSDATKALRAEADATLALTRLREDKGRRDVALTQAEQSRAKALDQVADVTRVLAAAEKTRDRAVVSSADARVSLNRAEENDLQTKKDVQKELDKLNLGAQTQNQQAYTDAVLASVVAQQNLTSAIAAATVAGEQIGGLTKTRGEFEAQRAAAAAAALAVRQAANEADKAASAANGPAAEEDLAKKRRDLQRQLEDSTKALRDANFGVADSNVAVQDSEISLSRQRRDVGIDAGLGLKQAEFGIVDARRSIVDFASDVIKAETQIADARQSALDNTQKVVDLEEKLVELRRKQAEAKPGDELNRLQAQAKLLELQIKEQNRRDTIDNRNNVLIPNAKDTIATSKDTVRSTRATVTTDSRVAGGNAASGTAQLDDVLSSLGLPTTSDIVTKSLRLQYAVSDSNVTYSTLAEALKAEATSVKKGIDVKVNLVVPVTPDGPSTVGNNTPGVLAESRRRLEAIGATVAQDVRFPEVTGPDNVSRRQSLVVQRQRVDSELAVIQSDLQGLERANLQGASQSTIQSNQKRIASDKAQIAELRKQLDELTKAIAVLPRFAGGSAVPGKRYRFNELGMEHFATRDGRVVPIMGGDQVGTFKMDGVIIPANVTPAVPRTQNASAPPQIIIQAPEAPREPTINVEHLEVHTAAKTVDAIGIVGAMAIYARKRS